MAICCAIQLETKTDFLRPDKRSVRLLFLMKSPIEIGILALEET